MKPEDAAEGCVKPDAAEDCVKPDLLGALVLSTGTQLDDGPALARASAGAMALGSGLESLTPEEWPALISRCREALRPDGALALRLAPQASVDHETLRETLAHRFGAVEMFAWDGLLRRPAAQAGTAELFALCWPFLPYATRSLELLRPRVVADGPDWRSSWLCERPRLSERFLLRATLDAIGASGGFDLRLRFLTSSPARLKIEAHLDLHDLAAGSAELLIASAHATARGEPSWAQVERIALEARTGAGESVDVRLCDVRVCEVHAGSRPSAFGGADAAPGPAASARADAPSSSAAPAGTGTVTAHGSAALGRAASRTSAQLRGRYDASYYRDMSGYGLGRELHEHVNLHRAHALLLAPAPARVLDVGAARGELALHLLRQGSEVTLLDYSPTAIDLARRLIGERPGVRYAVDEAANLGAHVLPQSQDAIFMTDFVEHVTVAELSQILGECRRALAPGGVLVIHTPERFSGAIVTAKAIHGLHLHLFEIDSLQELLQETFGAVEVFTWDGFERFQQRGHCIELFALASHAEAHVVRSLPFAPVGAGDGSAGAGQSAQVSLGAQARRSTCAIQLPRLPSRFIIDATVHIEPPDAEGELEILFEGVTGETLVRAARELSRLRTLPVQLRLASELLMPVSPPDWQRVERIVVSVSSLGTSPVELALSDVSLRESSTAAG